MKALSAEQVIMFNKSVACAAITMAQSKAAITQLL